jgi:hypothetical protein
MWCTYGEEASCVQHVCKDPACTAHASDTCLHACGVPRPLVLCIKVICKYLRSARVDMVCMWHLCVWNLCGMHAAYMLHDDG